MLRLRHSRNAGGVASCAWRIRIVQQPACVYTNFTSEQYFIPFPRRLIGFMAPNEALTRPSTSSSALDDPLLKREWMAIAWSREIGFGKTVARRLLGRDLVLWRSSEGLHCWRDLCIHRGARLSLGSVRLHSDDCDSISRGTKRDCLVCPYHAWEYAPTGECVRIPAHVEITPPTKARAETFAVREKYGVVWVAICEQDSSLPTFPLAHERGVRTVLAGPYRFRAKG